MTEILRIRRMIPTMLLLLAFTAVSSAIPYKPKKDIRILSEYGRPETGISKTYIWILKSIITKDGIQLNFFRKASDNTAICSVLLPKDPGKKIEWIGPNQSEKYEPDLMILSGFVVPCDILPVGDDNDGRRFKEKKKAGNRIFIKEHVISIQKLSTEEAIAKGWIKVDVETDQELKMVTVKDQRDRLVVRQAWLEGSNWWIYEETPDRRSWNLQWAPQDKDQEKGGG